jgi:hypothetical protein
MPGKRRTARRGPDRRCITIVEVGDNDYEVHVGGGGFKAVMADRLALDEALGSVAIILAGGRFPGYFRTRAEWREWKKRHGEIV